MPNLIPAVLILLAISPPVFGAKVQITEIEAGLDRGCDFIDVYTRGTTKGKGLLLENQLVIRYPNSEISGDLKITKRKTRRIQSISTAQEGDTAQIIINLKSEDVDYEVINIFGRDKSVIEISDRVDYTARLMAAWEQENLKTKGEELKPFKYEPAAAGSPLLRGKTIVIDAGHGGSDPGAFSQNGVPEKILTLQTAQKAASLLSKTGATVYLTRNDDRRNNLGDIVAFANQIKADAFVSIHYNSAYKREDLSGTETYYYNWISRKLGRSMHQSLIEGLNRKDRGFRRTMFYVVHHTRMPAVLVEPLYLSNNREEKLARSPEFQEKVAESIYKGVTRYFRNRVD